jgi:rhodanese-related sulfurtransferase
MRPISLRATAIVALLAHGCAPPPSRPPRVPADAAAAPRRAGCDPRAHRGPVSFPRSPGGAPEVDVAWLAAHRCDVRVVDVREPDEFHGPAGSIDVAQSVPLTALERQAERWDPTEPVVFVCRSGRRSERAVEQLKALGFRHVASLTGGMLAWRALSQPTVRVPAPPAPPRPRETPILDASTDPLTALRAALDRPDGIVMTRAASLLGSNTVSCIDGRTAGPVLGTPGGDAGELVLSLAALEEVLGHPVTTAWITDLFDRYVAAFGRFYLHTDEHALHRLADDLRGDARFASASSHWHSPEDISGFLRAPPDALEEPLLEHLTRAEHVGCGHLRLMMQSPARYGVREGLVQDVLRAALRRSWARPELLEFARLEGEHEERGVLEVRVEHEVHAHTLVPMVTPHVGARELFVLHPQVIDFVRAENAWFLVEQLAPEDAQRVDAAQLRRHIQRLGSRQLAATVERLAPHLPHFVLRVTSHGHTVERAPGR